MNEFRLPHDHGEGEDLDRLALPEAAHFQTLADIFKLLGDGSRLKIFWTLCHCEECVINLSAIVGMSSPAVSHHLKLLKSAGLIVSRREGKEVYYRAADSDIARLLHRVTEKVLSISCPKSEGENHEHQ